MGELWFPAIGIPAVLVFMSVVSAVRGQWMTATILAWVVIGFAAFAALCFGLYNAVFDAGRRAGADPGGR